MRVSSLYELKLTCDGLPDVHGVLAEVQSDGRQQAGHSCRERKHTHTAVSCCPPQCVVVVVAAVVEAVSLRMAFSGLRSMVFCMLGSSRSLKSEWLA